MQRLRAKPTIPDVPISSDDGPAKTKVISLNTKNITLEVENVILLSIGTKMQQVELRLILCEVAGHSSHEPPIFISLFNASCDRTQRNYGYRSSTIINLAEVGCKARALRDVIF